MSSAVANAEGAEHGAEKDPTIGRVFGGKYRVDARLRTGSMGAVYRARHIALEKDVCVKIMLDDVARDARLAQRFQREARAASRLDHPCSVTVLDHGREADGTLYIAMELIEGRDLFELLQDGPFAPERIVDIMTQTLSALAAAHDAGILHRDLKPENIMVTSVPADDGGREERVKVCDFGIAHLPEYLVEGERRLTTKGFIMGTPEYMSPEQARAEETDARSDLYSAGVILFHLLTGRVPFEAETPIGVALKQLHEEPPRPRDLNPNADPALEAICLRAMRKLPAERYASAREMRAALRSALAGRTSGVFPGAAASERGTLPELSATDPTMVVGDELAPALPEALRWRPKRRALATFASLGLAALAALAFARRAPSAPPIAIATAAAARAPAAHEPTPQANAASPASPPAPLPPAAVDAPLDAAEPREGSVSEASMKEPVKSEPAAKAPATAPRAGGPRAREVSPAPTPAPASDAPAPIAEVHDEATRVSEPARASEPPAVATPRAPAATPAPAPSPVSPAPPPSSPSPAHPSPAHPSPAALSPAAPAASPPAPAYAVETARVDLGAATRVLGATAAAVDRALATARPKLDACYRSALPKLSGALEGSAVLHVETDDVGVVRRARLDGPLANELGACASRAVMGLRIAHVDTGTMSAELPLAFRAR